MFTAHIHPETGVEQTCRDHCRNTAGYAEKDLEGIGLGKAAYFAGLMHDAGKFTNAFNTYIHRSAAGERVQKGSVIHTFSAVSWLMKNHHQEEEPITFDDIAAEILAYADGAHHGNFDCINSSGENGFRHRMEKQPDYDREAMQNFFKECISEEELTELLQEAYSELIQKLQCISDPEGYNDPLETYFYEGMLSRLLLSAVIDGDRRDTAEFMAGKDYSKIIPGNPELWQELHASLEEFLEKMPNATEIQKARRELSEYCEKFSEEPGGVYRLNLPTGAGKTLSGLRFALAHAQKKEKKRIIYTAPLISILDQNAQVIREALGREEVVLEHHSNILHDQENTGELERYELLAETWDAPVIITTMVQFLNTLFSGRTTCIRRFQSLADSVILIDEVQTVPLRYLTLFNLGVNFLAEVCHATVILCSATQPCLEAADHPMRIRPETFVPADQYLRYEEIFRRTEVTCPDSCQMKEIPDIVLRKIEEKQSILLICNKKGEAQNFFRELQNRKPEDVRIFHLSSSMCMAHRKRTLKEIYEALDRKDRVICVSTQVVEAGVDISFACVIRLAAGLDRIVQSAGRCNRNGESDQAAPVYVIHAEDENLKMLPDIRRERSAFLALLHDWRKKPEKYQHSLTSDAAVNFYYKTLFSSMNPGEQDGYVDSHQPSLFQLLSSNQDYCNCCEEDPRQHYMTNQAFRTAGELFRVIDQEGSSIIVPYDEEGETLISELYSDRGQHDLAYRKKLLDQAKAYSVSAYSYQLKKLSEEGALQESEDGVITLLGEYYDREIGLTEEGGCDGCTLIL